MSRYCLLRRRLRRFQDSLYRQCRHREETRCGLQHGAVRRQAGGGGRLSLLGKKGGKSITRAFLAPSIRCESRSTWLALAHDGHPQLGGFLLADDAAELERDGWDADICLLLVRGLRGVHVFCSMARPKFGRSSKPKAKRGSSRSYSPRRRARKSREPSWRDSRDTHRKQGRT